MTPINENHKHETHAFEADRVIFQVSDLANDPKSFNSRLVAALGAFLQPNGIESSQIERNKKSPDRPWRSMVNVPTLDDLRVIEFLPQQQVQGSQRFALIPLELEGHAKNDLEPDDVLKFLNDAYIELEDSFINPGGEASEDKFKPFGLRLMSISPNWLGGGLPHNKPTGGPGSLPGSLAAETERRFEIRNLEVLDSLSRFRQPGAQIVIFDTARDLFTGDAPMEVHRYPNPNYPNQPEPAEFTALRPYWEDKANNDHYDMSDHGPFIASIIHKIAPGAQIFLYEVLNRYGDGSFVTVSHGLTEALNRHAQGATKLVFNCSLGMVHKLPENKSPHETWKEFYPKLWESLIQELIFKALREAFAQVISHPNITVVAAAGNDANEMNEHAEVVEPGRPSAWYPAAFDKVLSVAALPKHYPRDANNGNKFMPASYSNKARSPGKDEDQVYSFATFGGERRNKLPSPFSPVDAVLGVYVGKIPRENPDGSFSESGSNNQTLVGQWAGTSFATPIISALVAAQENELNNLVGGNHNHDSEPLLTIDDENVIPVHQV